MNFTTHSISVGIATFKSQALHALLAPQGAGSQFTTLLDSLQQDLAGTAPTPLAAPTGIPGLSPLSASGRNLALFDPESAYRMMSLINYRDVYYKAQYAELSQLQAQLKEMEQAGLALGKLAADATADGIKAGLQQFVAQYNSWVNQVAPDLQAGGVLADTQAAQISRYEMEQSLKYPFYGAQAGLHGLDDLGLAIDGRSGLATLDAARLDAVLAGNRQGVVSTLQQFSTSFAKSASLLNESDNFVPRQLDNLDRAIHYIADNRPELQAEFGTGDPARPTGQIAQALAAYNASYANAA